jgi:hypothetical protein
VSVSTLPGLRDEFPELPDTPPRCVRRTLIVEVEYGQRPRGELHQRELEAVRPNWRSRLIRPAPGGVAGGLRWCAGNLLQHLVGLATPSGSAYGCR